MTGQPNRIEFIDALRGFAIIGVIGTHAASAVDLTGPLRRISDFGGDGVQLFFLVSAFTIFMTYNRSLEREQNPISNFFIRRLCRIIPIYWAGIVLYTMVFGLASRGWMQGPELWHYPFHATLTNIFLPNGTSSVVPGGWSISVEVLFYLTAPIWFFLVRSLAGAAMFTIGWIVVGTIFIHAAPRIVDLGMTDPNLGYMFWYRQLPSQLACFGFGMMLYFGLRSPEATGLLRRSTVQVGLTIAGILLVALVIRGVRGVPSQYVASSAFLAFALVLSQRPSAWLVNRVTRTIGQISYSAYLLHFLVIQTLLSVGTWPESVPVRATMLFIGSLAVTLPLSWVSWRWYETFWTGFARSRVADLEARSGRHPTGHGMDTPDLVEPVAERA